MPSLSNLPGPVKAGHCEPLHKCNASAAGWSRRGLALEVALLSDAGLSEQLRLLADVPPVLARLAAGRRSALMREASRRLRGAA